MLKDCCETIMTQLESVTESLEPDEYSSKIDILSEVSIGMHFRHIIEFFDCVVNGVEEGVIDYDKRERNKSFENNPKMAGQRVKELRKWIEEQYIDIPVNLKSDMCENDIVVKSSLQRELIYAIEHAIHHMAIIKIALLNSFPDVKLEDNFGVAFSTLRYREKECAQ